MKHTKEWYEQVYLRDCAKFGIAPLPFEEMSPTPLGMMEMPSECEAAPKWMKKSEVILLEEDKYGKEGELDDTV